MFSISLWWSYFDEIDEDKLDCLPDREMVLAGLISSSENIGSRTETGLGLPALSSTVFSTSPVFRSTPREDPEGDAVGEHNNSLSSVKSWKRTKKHQFSFSWRVYKINQKSTSWDVFLTATSTTSVSIGEGGFTISTTAAFVSTT